jgi:hypothetical protein
MVLKIDSSNLFSRNYLVLKNDGIKFCETGMLWGGRRFRFNEIRGVLMSHNDTLSFQAGNEVFSIRTKPGNPKHQAVVAALLTRLKNS